MDEKQFDALMKEMGEKKDKETKGGEDRNGEWMMLSLLMAMFASAKPTSPSSIPSSIEKQVAYLTGKVDTLEKILIKKC